MPVTTFNYELEALLPYLEKERTSPRRGETRLLVSGDWLDSPDYVDLVEETGAVVAMDDLDTGSRYFWGRVDEQGDPIDALAKRYIGRPGCPRMYTWDSQVDQVIQWSRDFDIDGVVELVLARSRPRQMRVPFFRDALTKAGIPVLSVTREYQLANIGQLKTRVGAFLEMITAKRGARLTGNTGPD